MAAVQVNKESRNIEILSNMTIESVIAADTHPNRIESSFGQMTNKSEWTLTGNHHHQHKILNSRLSDSINSPFIPPRVALWVCHLWQYPRLQIY